MKKQKQSKVRDLPEGFEPSAINVFQGKGKDVDLNELEVMDKESITNQEFVLHDLCHFDYDNGMFPQKSQTFNLLIGTDKQILGTVLIGGQIISQQFEELQKNIEFLPYRVAIYQSAPLKARILMRPEDFKKKMELKKKLPKPVKEKINPITEKKTKKTKELPF